MIINSYKEFNINEKVCVKRELIDNFLLSTTTSLITKSTQDQILEYVVKKNNIITISSIEINNIILNTLFYFFECNGNLLYGQFIKMFPNFYILDKLDFT